MNSMPEIKLPPGRMMTPMSAEHEDLMQQHLRDENPLCAMTGRPS